MEQTTNPSTPAEHPLTLCSANKGRSGGPWSPDDYDVMCEGRVIGRIFKANAGVPPDHPWMWTITAVVVAPAVRSHGFTESKDQAKTAFAEHWRKWLVVRSS